MAEEYAFLFQTFSRSDPPGKAPLTRGRYVFKKKKENKKKEKKRKKKFHYVFSNSDLEVRS